MSDWAFAILAGAVIFGVGSCYHLLQQMERLQRQVQHMHTVLYNELRKMQGKDY